MATTNEHASNAIVSMAAFYAAVLAEVTKANGDLQSSNRALQDRIKQLDAEVARMAIDIASFEREAAVMNTVIDAAQDMREHSDAVVIDEWHCKLIDALRAYDEMDGSNATG